MNAPSPLAATVLMGAGMMLGFALGFAFVKASPEVVTQVVTEQQVVPERLSQEEIEQICATLTVDAKQQLLQAQEAVASLRGTLEAREQELAELQEQRRRSAAAGAAVQARITALEAEVGALRTQLVTVTAERDGLIVELKDTVRKLEVQIAETEKFKREAKKWKHTSTANAWRSFVAEAKVAICDRGTKKRHESCHEAVDEALGNELQDLFERCVDSEQAVPMLAQSEKEDGLPAFAQALPNDKRFSTRGWHIRFCDPSLPEAGQNPETRTPP
jgi:DNA repair exonuclease SbcCD ATPase subunit